MNNEIKRKAEKCKCSMRQQLIGDGCEICNPEYMKEKTAKEAAEWAVKQLTYLQELRNITPAEEKYLEVAQVPEPEQ